MFRTTSIFNNANWLPLINNLLRIDRSIVSPATLAIDDRTYDDEYGKYSAERTKGKVVSSWEAKKYHHEMDDPGRWDRNYH